VAARAGQPVLAHPTSPAPPLPPHLAPELDLGGSGGAPRGLALGAARCAAPRQLGVQLQAAQVVEAGEQQARGLGVAVQARQHVSSHQGTQLQGRGAAAGLHRQVGKGGGQQQLRKRGLALRHGAARGQRGAGGLPGGGGGGSWHVAAGACKWQGAWFWMPASTPRPPAAAWPHPVQRGPSQVAHPGAVRPRVAAPQLPAGQLEARRRHLGRRRQLQRVGAATEGLQVGAQGGVGLLQRLPPLRRAKQKAQRGLRPADHLHTLVHHVAAKKLQGGGPQRAAAAPPLHTRAGPGAGAAAASLAGASGAGGLRALRAAGGAAAARGGQRGRCRCLMRGGAGCRRVKGDGGGVQRPRQRQQLAGKLLHKGVG
jgi:hypothetical protein